MDLGENSKMVVLPVTLKGANYLLWARLAKNALGGRGLWEVVEEGKNPKKTTLGEDGKEVVVIEASDKKKGQEDLMVLSILLSSLEPSLQEAYAYCETSKELWDTLKKVYGNQSNISRVFEVKRAINTLSQEDTDFDKHFGKFRSLWAELEMLRPGTVDPDVLNERREQDKVFALLFTLNPGYTDLIKHILRGKELPSLEEVCAQIQKEQGSVGLFGGKRDLVLANQAEGVANKGTYKAEEKKVWICDHCKKKGHGKDKCWILHPHLKPQKFRSSYNEARANFTGDVGEPSTSRTIRSANEGGEGKALASSSSTAMRNNQDEAIRRSDIEVLIKILKDNSCNTLGTSLHATTSGISLNALTRNQFIKPLDIDSGASHHMISDLKLIKNIVPALGNVMIANGERVPIKGIGDLRLFDKDSKAFYMPSFTSNLLSVKRATNDLNCSVTFTPNNVYFQDIESSRLLGKGVTKGDLYLLEDTKLSTDLSYALSSFSDLPKDVLWHARLGHPHSRALNIMLPSISFKTDCEACILGKHCKSVFSRSSTIYENCFDLIHSDVWTAPCISRENHKYFVTFIDEKSKYTWITLLQTKDRVLEAFINFQNYVTNHFNAKIKILRSDNGGEYTSNAFKQHLAKCGMIHQNSCPYTPQQNGVAERKNRHLMEVARSMMFHTNVPKRFWGDAVLTACYLINRIPTRILQDQSPYEVLNRNKSSIEHMRVFGCLCFVLIPGERRDKLAAKSTKAVFIGYSPHQKGYKCYVQESRRVLISRDVKFVESRGYYEEQSWDELKNLSQSASDRASNLRRVMESLGIRMPQERVETVPEDVQQPTEANTDDIRTPHLDHEGDNQAEQNQEDSASHDQAEHHAQEEQDHHTTQKETVEPVVSSSQPTNNQVRRSTRIRKPVDLNWKNNRVYFNAQAVAHPIQGVCSLAQYPQEHVVFIGELDQEYIPRSYEEAMEHEEWKESVGSETNAMIIYHTWYEAELPKGKRAVTSRWIFTIKYNADGTVERRKTRLVARGFTQTYGEDYLDTFAPVAKLHTIRIILSLAVNLEWDLWQMDVKNAFLQGELEDEVYMRPPPGLEHLAIYGLKQSPRAWYHKLSTTLNGRGFVKSEADHTLFTLTSKQGIVVILVYVDDIIITGSDKEGILLTKAFLRSSFDIKDLGELKYFLGIEMCRSKDGLFLSQRKYTLDLLNEAGDLGGRAAKTPLEDGYKVLREGEIEDKLYADVKHYRRMVGKLIYLTITRPDVCFAVNQVSQHMQAPKIHHWNMVERILRYLREAPGQGVWMGCNKSTEIVGYCDADWAGDRVDRRSTTGYCTFIGGNLVTWKSKKQNIVSCSSAEAEYRAMRKLTSELIWIRNLLQDLGIEISTPITMHCDNQAAIHIASNSVFHERTKHIEVDCHKVRQAVEQRIILPCYTRSEDQLADIFTKAASTKVCEFIHSKLGLVDLSSH
ncbi:hypothetical protein Bca4012_030513 [Brassica carinata]